METRLQAMCNEKTNQWANEAEINARLTAEITAAHIESIEAMKASHKEDIETYKAEQAFLGMAISILKSDKEKQAEEILALKKACIVYHNQIINMQKAEEK